MKLKSISFMNKNLNSNNFENDNLNNEESQYKNLIIRLKEISEKISLIKKTIFK